MYRYIIITICSMLLMSDIALAEDYQDYGMGQSFEVELNSTGQGDTDIYYQSDIVNYTGSGSGTVSLDCQVGGAQYQLTNTISRNVGGFDTSNELSSTYIGGSSSNLWLHSFYQNIYITTSDIQGLEIDIENILPQSLANHLYNNYYVYGINEDNTEKVLYSSTEQRGMSKFIEINNTYNFSKFRIRFGCSWFAQGSVYRNVILYQNSAGTPYDMNMYRFNINKIYSNDEEKSLLQGIIDSIKSMGSTIADKLSDITSTITDSITNLGEYIKNSIYELFVPTDIEEVLNNASDNVISSMGILGVPLDFTKRVISTISNNDSSNFVLGCPSIYTPFSKTTPIIDKFEIDLYNMLNNKVFAYVGNDSSMFNDLRKLYGVDGDITLLTFFRAINNIILIIVIVRWASRALYDYFDIDIDIPDGGEED